MKRALAQIFSWWSGQTLGTRFFTWRRGMPAGTDELGNRYYQEKRGPRRWVIFCGQSEASAVPPAWNAWLRNMVEAPPGALDGAHVHRWQQPHQANLTGTALAYRPPGSLASQKPPRPVTGDYEPWTP